jgi:hypothetical protein
MWDSEGSSCTAQSRALPNLKVRRDSKYCGAWMFGEVLGEWICNCCPPHLLLSFAREKSGLILCQPVVSIEDVGMLANVEHADLCWPELTELTTEGVK